MSEKTTIKFNEVDGDWLIWSHTGECLGRTNDPAMAAQWCRDNGHDDFVFDSPRLRAAGHIR